MQQAEERGGEGDTVEAWCGGLPLGRGETAVIRERPKMK